MKSTVILTITLLLISHLWGGGTTQVERHSLSIQPKGTLVVHNDFGRIQVNGWEEKHIYVRIRKITPEGRLAKVLVNIQRYDSLVKVSTHFREHRAESAYLEIQVPQGISVQLWGSNPAIEVYGVRGSVRASTLTGLITAEDLLASASLLSQEGDIYYRGLSQSHGDVRLESNSGSINCVLGEGLNIRGWIRAGGKASWGDAVSGQQGSIQREMGTGGPLFYANSLEGDVRCQFNSSTSYLANEAPDTEPRQKVSHQQNASLITVGPAARKTASSDPSGQEDNGRGIPPKVASHTPWPADTPDKLAFESGYALKVNVDWTYLNVSVRDRDSNRSVPNLVREDFLVYENGAPQTIEKFQTSETPFHLLFLLDVSGSTRSHLNMIKKASIDFTREINSDDRIAVATFNSYTRLIQDFTNDRRRVRQSINRIRSGGGTAFYDALITSVREYMEGIEGRKAIVVFTDGVDNQLTGDYNNGSRTRFQELYREVREDDSLIYTIFLDTDRDAGTSRSRSGILGDILRGRTPPIIPGKRDQRGIYEEARRQLETLAEQTGGRSYSPRRISDLTHVYSEIADDLRIQYTLAYSSTNSLKDGSWRKIWVKIKDRPELQARTRRGYSAPSGGTSQG